MSDFPVGTTTARYLEVPRTYTERRTSAELDRPLGERVVELLRRGRTVRGVAELTTWPRDEVMRLAQGAGLQHDPRDDTFQDPASPRLGKLLAAVDGALGQLEADLRQVAWPRATSYQEAARQRHLAMRLRALALIVVQGRESEYDADVEAQARAVIAESDARRRRLSGRPAPEPYPVSEVRRWARTEGMDVPTHGRYLPLHIVNAWRERTETSTPPPAATASAPPASRDAAAATPPQVPPAPGRRPKAG